jgi:hypothetical protein
MRRSSALAASASFVCRQISMNGDDTGARGRGVAAGVSAVGAVASRESRTSRMAICTLQRVQHYFSHHQGTMVPKWYQNGPKMVPKWSQNGTHLACIGVRRRERRGRSGSGIASIAHQE